MGIADIKSNGSATTSKAPRKATARKTTAAEATAAPTTDDAPTVAYAVINGGGKVGLVYGSAEVIREGRTVKGVSKAGNEKLLVVGTTTFTVGDITYGTYSKAA